MKGTIVATQYSAMVPSGTWFLGDPKVALQPGMWISVLAATRNFQWPLAMMFEFQVLAYPVANGTYLDQEGHKYEVESGFLGLVPASGSPAGYGPLQQVGRVVQWTSPVVVVASDKAYLAFGPYRIKPFG